MKSDRFKYIKQLTILVALWLCAMPAIAQDGTNIKVFADKKNTAVTYAMSHALHDWDGTSRDVNSVIIFNKEAQRISSVAVLIKLSSFDSKNANRDSHMIEVLDGIKFPQISFGSTSVTQEGMTLNVAGNLTFHGITHPVSFRATQKRSGNQIIVSGDFEIKMTDYSVDPPSLMGISCKDWIKLTFTAVYNLP